MMPDFNDFSNELKPTPIEDPNARRIYEAVKARDPWIKGKGPTEDWTAYDLLQAKMAHDNAMRRALWTLDGRENDRRFITRLAWWALGTVTAVLLLIATQCTGPYGGGAILDDPDHYSRRH